MSLLNKVQNKDGTPNYLNIIKYAIGLIFVLWLIIGSFTSIPAGHIGIQDTFGQVNDIGLPAGFVIKLPITNIIPMTIQTEKYSATATAASSDLQDVSTEITVNYRLLKGAVINMYKEVGLGFAYKLIVPAVQESVKASTAKFSAVELITQRPKVKIEIEKSLTDRLQSYGLIMENVSITDFKFSPQFTQAIEEKVTAEQSALKAKNVLEQVKIEKEQTITKAEASAQAIKLNADADAYALDVINKQLEKNKDLISYNAVNKWDGKLPYLYGGTQPLPFINIKEN